MPRGYAATVAARQRPAQRDQERGGDHQRDGPVAERRPGPRQAEGQLVQALQQEHGAGDAEQAAADGGEEALREQPHGRGSAPPALQGAVAAEHQQAEHAGGEPVLHGLVEVMVDGGVLAARRGRVVLHEVRAALGRVGHPGRVAGHEALAEGHAHALGDHAAGAHGGQPDAADQGGDQDQLDEHGGRQQPRGRGGELAGEGAWRAEALDRPPPRLRWVQAARQLLVDRVAQMVLDLREHAPHVAGPAAQLHQQPVEVVVDRIGPAGASRLARAHVDHPSTACTPLANSPHSPRRARSAASPAPVIS